MIGCDIIKISRFDKNLDRLKSKILNADEQKEFNKVKNKLEYIAGRWAAKEAIFKAANIKNVSILNNLDGSPYVANYPNIQISISHEKKYAIAFALVKL